ncbi:beta-4C adrenergic receptor [Biomphalaria glabrata]
MNNSSCVDFQLKSNDSLSGKDESGIIFIAFISMITLFTIVFNSILFLALASSLMRSEKRKMSIFSSNQSLTKLIMTSFVAVEIVIGAFLMPLFVVETVNDGHWKLGLLTCMVKNFFSGWMSQVSIFHICSMAVDRFLAIKYPLLYRRLTLRHALLQASLDWMIPLLVFTLSKLMDWYHDKLDKFPGVASHDFCSMTFNCFFFPVMLAFGYVFPLLVAIILYLFILLEVHKFHIRTGRYKEQRSQDFKRDNIISINVLPDSGSVRNTAFEANIENPDVLGKVSKNRPKPDRKNLKAYKTVGCIIVCILVCWTPPYVLSPAYVFNISLLSWPLQSRMIFVLYMNAAINPLIYMFNKSIRRAVRTLLCSKCCRN